ncbi:hypothetical protein BDZ89DRAFT_1138253 [Hymenopellis radicata]|nr:hypothetical protein BDZ89DRAFT_1138253 [Hymenopellis radicata]
MSTQAPFIDNDILDTPAQEWSESTTAAVQKEADLAQQRPTIEPAVSTPGPKMPGHYGRDVDPVVDTPPAESSGGLLETAKQYIPQAVASYFPGAQSKPQTSLPSQEIEGNILSSVGVGSLPGRASEISVAKLPDERAAESQSSPPTTSYLTPATNPDTSRDETQSSPVSMSELTGRSTSTEMSSIPGTSSASYSATTTESDLSTPPPTPLPNVDAAPMAETVSHREATGLPSPHTPPDHKSKSSFEKVNGRKETHLTTPSVNPDGRTYATAREESSAPLPSDNKVAPMLPHSPSYTSSPHQASPAPLTTQTTETSSWSNGSGSSGTGSVGRKSTFMDKVKGEVKVLSGKLSHNEERIEEGKKLMGKA